MKNKKVLALALALLVAFAMMPVAGFAGEDASSTATDTAASAKSNDIVILGTSDVHCGIDQNIGYAGLAAYKKAMEDKYNYVALVDAGDAIQGDTIGTLSKGEYIVDIMNEVGYDVAVPGNHEFDYGMDQFLNVIAKKMKATYVSANFVKDGKTVFEPYKMMTFGDKKVAFVGITTPETLTASRPTNFQDKDGNYIYDFCNDTAGEKLYKAVQTAVDAAKKDGASYVVAVAHLGDDEASAPWTSMDVLKNTSEIDVLLDGHAHSTLVKSVKNKDGKSIQMVATGTKLENIGKIVIAENGAISAEYVTGEVAKDKDSETAKFIDSIKAKYADLENRVVATSKVDLVATDADGNRIVRYGETNLGDLCADAYRAMTGADIAFANGGGIRVSIPKGDITYGQIIAVHPFGNMISVVEATGQQILDALELGSKDVGAGENGGFLQVSGITYTINSMIESSVEVNENGEFVKVAGAYRVSDVKVGGEDLQLDKTYSLASNNYLLASGGDGYVMFKESKVLQDEVILDNQALINYIQDNLGGVVGDQYERIQGRIKILSNDLLTELSEKLAVAEYECKVSAKSKTKAVKLSWNACAADGVKYQIYKSTKATKGFKKVITTSKATYTAKKLTKGKTYYFKVRAIKTISGRTYYGHWSTVVAKKAA